ncbi:MAG TPA: GTP cyclohydrolase I [Polyangiaceae bacterium]|jgi:GTP cyclohydrolase I|nr:GTP cyclohydrolase I [Polyangiaceae bacterium]
MSVDRQAAERAIADFLRALGQDPALRPELEKTPERVVAAYADELLAGYGVDVPQLIAEGSSAEETRPSSIVAVKDIQVTTVCPHHLLPAQGSALVAYAPGQRVLGLGTLARLVEAYARRLTLQEGIAQSVVRALLDHAGAGGAYCEIELRHGCLSARGPCQVLARAVTVARGGTFAEHEGAAALTLALGRQAGASP